MSKFHIVEEIESIQKQPNPDMKRLRELQAKLHDPLENECVKRIMAKKHKATTKELKLLISKGVSTVTIAKNLNMRRKEVARMVGRKTNNNQLPEHVVRDAAERLKSDPELTIKGVAEELDVPDYALSHQFKKLNISIRRPKRISEATMKAIELMNNDLTMSVREAVKLTGVSQTSISNQIKKGAIKERVL